MNEDEHFLEQLITLVQEQPVLYDKSETNYYNVAVRQNIWIDIGRQCNKSDAKCKHRWRLLRERYTKELKRQQAIAGEIYKEPWKYFDRMMFLKESVTLRAKRKKLNETSTPNNSETITVFDISDDDEESAVFEDNRPLSVSSSMPQSTEDTQSEMNASFSNKNVDSMLQGLVDVANICKKQPIEGKDFASLLAIKMLMDDLPERLKDEFLKHMYVKVMEMRETARMAGELYTNTDDTKL